MVGVGQLCGAFLTGKVVDRLGIRHISIINTLLTLITMGLTIITLLVGFDDEWPQWIRYELRNIIDKKRLGSKRD